MTGYSTVQGDFHHSAHPRGRFLWAPCNPAHLSAYDPTAEYFNPTADCGGSAEDPPFTCIIPPRVCGGFPMKSNDVIMIDRYSYLTSRDLKTSKFLLVLCTRQNLMFSTHSMKYIWFSSQKSKFPLSLLSCFQSCCHSKEDTNLTVNSKIETFIHSFVHSFILAFVFIHLFVLSMYIQCSNQNI